MILADDGFAGGTPEVLATLQAHHMPSLQIDADGFEIERMLYLRALRADLKVWEVPSFEARRLYGKSRLRAFPDGWRVLCAIGKE